MRFNGKIAIVTGGASGIGDAVVRELLSQGARVGVLDLNGDLLTQRRQEFGSVFLGVQGDVTDEGAVAHFVASCAQAFGGLHMAFNAAGAHRGGPILRHSVQDWDFTLNVCLKGVLLTVQHAARQMAAGGGGAIVNVASVCAHMGVYGGAAYCSAKSGVEMLTKVAALELAEQNIRVNAILPGYTLTPGMRMASEAPELHQAILERIPLKRAANAQEIAVPALFLASDGARYVTGTSLVVDGGWELTGCPDFRRVSQHQT